MISKGKDKAESKDRQKKRAVSAEKKGNYPAVEKKVSLPH